MWLYFKASERLAALSKVIKRHHYGNSVLMQNNQTMLMTTGKVKILQYIGSKSTSVLYI